MGNLNPLPQVAAHYNWKNVDRSEPLHANQYQPKGASTYGQNESLEDLFINLVKDMYYAEKQILKALPKMAKQADSTELRRAFEHHLKETEGQVQRLEQVFALCDTKPAAKTCPAIKGILEEGEEDIEEADDSDVLDAGMIADAKAVENYEIARYGTLIAWANQLGMKEAATLLNQTLEQE